MKDHDREELMEKVLAFIEQQASKASPHHKAASMEGQADLEYQEKL
jgi:hypothetical protein